MQAAMSKAALPPGFDTFRYKDDGSSKSFFISAQYKGKSLEEIAQHYGEHFAKEGWENLDPSGEHAPGLLMYQRGKESCEVTSVKVGAELHVLVTYDELEYTHEEFAALAKETAAQEALKLAEEVVNAYRSLTNYTDTGEYECIDDGKVLQESEFRTAYAANGDLLFEYADELSNGFKASYALSKSGDRVQAMSGHDSEPEEYQDISLAVAALTGVTSGTAHNVPTLLLGLEGKDVFTLANLKIAGEDRLPDGTVCIRLQGKGFFGDDEIIWIGKDDLLIRKIEVVKDAKNREATGYHPRTDVTPSPEDLAFRRPAK